MKEKFNNMNKKQKSTLLVAVLAIICVLLLGGLAYTLGLGPVNSKDDEDIKVSIPTGSGASMIVEILDDEGLVRNKLCAKINARIGGYDTLQANTYRFSKSMSFKEMMNAIDTGDINYLSNSGVTIIAGERLTQVASSMAEILPYSKEEILKKWSDETYLKSLIKKYWFLTDDILSGDILYPLEGYFYADTYFVDAEMESIEVITEKFLDRMGACLSERKSDIEKSNFSVHEVLTLASVVTKEGGSTDKDLPIVAGVFINRLNDGMSLGSDVTVNYIYDQDKVNLTQSQLANDSPYNTRKHAGLPPSAICTVIDSRIDAVLNYKKTDYMYFYGCPDGTVIFSKTLKQHEKAAKENPWPNEK